MGGGIKTQREGAPVPGRREEFENAQCGVDIFCLLSGLFPAVFPMPST